VIHELVDRGQQDGSFRTDVPPGWLVTAALALVHATADEVRRDDFDPDAALDVLSLTIVDLFRRPAGGARS
jgi:hypothetical protein